MTTAVPASFLAIPFDRLMHYYGLADNLWAVIAAEVTFATPYAILIFQQYGKLIPLELDDAARVDGASPGQVYWRICFPDQDERCPIIGRSGWAEMTDQIPLRHRKRVCLAGVLFKMRVKPLHQIQRVVVVNAP